VVDDSWDLTRTSPEAGPPGSPSGNPELGPGAPAAQLPAGLERSYQVVRELGRGAMGAVFLAEERSSGRRVAVKVVLGEPSPRRLARFRREGEVTARLTHPGIVRVHAAGEEDGQLWLAYEYIEGCRTLDELAPQLDRRRRVEVLLEVARALGHAHERAVVHRDVKPTNILLDDQQRVRLADFGLATAEGEERLTRTGTALGTPHYMAPEQLSRHPDEDPAPTLDVWALGVSLYWLLTDQLPFADAEDFLELTRRLASARFPAPRSLDPTIPPELEHVVARAMSREPARRHPDGAAFARDLELYLESGELSQSTVAFAQATRRGRWPVLAGVLALVLAGVGLALGVAGEQDPAAEPDSPRGSARVLVDPPRGAVLEPSATVSGRVEGEATSVQLTGPAGVLRVPLLEGRFRTRVPLEPGDNLLRLQALAGREPVGEPVELGLRRLIAPAWFSSLPSHRLPPLPLPDGLAFGEQRETYRNQTDGSLLVWVPPGVLREVGEQGPGEVALDGFFLGRYEVSWAEYEAFCSATSRVAPARRILELKDFVTGELSPTDFLPSDDHPVFRVNFEEARAYCEWAGLRLPTEEEWTLAARGPRNTAYPWGDRPPQEGSRRCNLEGAKDGFRFTSPRGAFPEGTASCGAEDLSGNVEEWLDGWLSDAREVRVVRGGSWSHAAPWVACDHREGRLPELRSERRGFRVAR
jgi:predicted Ser/Thr protein kinase